jgi:hypothetical protein
VKLSAEKGEFSVDEGGCPLESLWALGVFEEPGDYVFPLNAVGEDGTQASASLTVSVESLETEIDVEKLDITHVGAKLVHISPKDLTAYRQAVEIIPRLKLEAYASLTVQFGKEASFTGKSMDLELAALFLSKFREITMTLPQVEKETTVDGAIKLRQPTPLDETKIRVFSRISKALFRLRVKRHE